LAGVVAGGELEDVGGFAECDVVADVLGEEFDEACVGVRVVDPLLAAWAGGPVRLERAAPASSLGVTATISVAVLLCVPS
jgi:hypothetical protein